MVYIPGRSTGCNIINEMRTQPRILRLFANRAREGRTVDFTDVWRELRISTQAAVSTLERLWRLQLIIPVGPRPAGFKWQPAPEERVAALRFQLTDRGEEKLRWWKEQDGKQYELWPVLAPDDR
jgi:hypothetical protein